MAILSPRLIRLADLPLHPWKNGGGVTVEITIHPPGATTDGFDWRISQAVIDRDGPFSAFPGITRWIMLVEGAGFTLDFPGVPPLEVTERFHPHRFDGGTPAYCRLRGGSCRDLNVMARSDLAVDVSVRPAGVDAPPEGHALIAADRALVRLDPELVLQVVAG